jgi:uncharacterized membrane protein YfcA
LLGLALLALCFSGLWVLSLRRETGRRRPGLIELGIGFLTDFLDTLGIGSFATTTTLYRWRSLVGDRELPGTLNVGHAIPTALQAFIYISAIEVEIGTLIALIAASVLGAWFGAGWVARWPERQVRFGMGFALLAAACLILARLFGWLPPGSDQLGLRGGLLVAGVIGNFLLGVLMTLGIGLYAPCMILVALLGMNPKAAFPIMMGSCAFLMPFAGLRFVRARSYSAPAALGLCFGGLPAVWIAAYLVKELALDTLRWLVVIVVAYTAVSLLRAARRSEVTNRARPSAVTPDC